MGKKKGNKTYINNKKYIIYRKKKLKIDIWKLDMLKVF